ncbi:MAG TPA: FHA domain-containing protein [Kofleriaceae bacterium]|jgi:hypothetical protein
MRLDRRLVCALGVAAVVGLASAAPASPRQQIAITAKLPVMRVWGAYVETVVPVRAELLSLFRRSHQARNDGEHKPRASNTPLIAGLVIGGLMVIGGAILIVRRGRGRPAAPPGMIHPTQPAAFAARPTAPSGLQPGQGQPGVPIARTVATQGGTAPTAFGSQTVGSVTCTRGQLAGQRFALTATGVIVGRQPGVAHVLVTDHRASGRHVWIGHENGILVAVDQNTTNGTYINDVASGRITRSALRDGDIIIVGDPDCLSLQVRFG